MTVIDAPARVPIGRREVSIILPEIESEAPPDGVVYNRAQRHNEINPVVGDT